MKFSIILIIKFLIKNNNQNAIIFLKILYLYVTNE